MLDGILVIFLLVSAVLARSNQWLSLSGAIAFFLLGSLTVSAFHLQGLFLLAVFFVTANLAGKWPNPHKGRREKQVVKPRRTSGQVLANGMMAIVASCGQWLSPSPIWLGILVGSISEANADTWASEIGVTSVKSPRSLIGWKPLPPGVSGGVSLKGFIAAFVGAGLISFISLLLWPYEFPASRIVTAAIFTLIGFLGAAFDSLLGAVFQARYSCKVCHKETDEMVHCGESTVYKKGWSWLTNSRVNLISVILSGLIGGGVMIWIK